jgi:hypothetical protein
MLTAEYRKVQIKDRILARLIDVAVYWLILIMVDAISHVLREIIPLAFYTFIPTIPYIIFILRDGYKEGHGYGKAKRGILVRRTSSELPCSYTRSFIRNILGDIYLYFQQAYFWESAFINAVKHNVVNH